MEDENFDILTALCHHGLEDLALDILQDRTLTSLDLWRCQLVCRSWTTLVLRLQQHRDRTGLSRRLWRDTENRPRSVLQCRRERSVCTVSAIASDEISIAIALAGSGRIEVWDRQRAEKQWEATAHEEGVYSVDIGGDRVVSGGEDNKVRVWCRYSGTVLKVLDHHTFVVWNVKLWLGTLFTCSYDCSAYFINTIDDYKIIKTVRGPFAWGNALSSDATGRFVASQHTATHNVLIWDLNKATELPGQQLQAANRPHFVLKGHEGEVNCVRFRVNAGLVVTGADDGTVRVWSLAEGEEIENRCRRVLRGVGDKVWCVDVDVRRVVAGGRRGRVVVWHLEDGDEEDGQGDVIGITEHDKTTAVGAIKLEEASLITADGIENVVVSDYWRVE